MPQQQLTEQEIALLAGQGMSPGAGDRGENPTKGPRDEGRLNGMQIAEIHGQLRTALNQLSNAWEPLLRTRPKFQVNSIEQTTFGGFLLSRKQSSLIQLISCGDCPCSLVVLPPKIFYLAIDRMLGGSGKSSENGHKTPTDIELRLADRLTAPFLDHLPIFDSAESPVVVKEQTTNARTARWLPPQEPLAIATIDCEIAKVVGTMHWAFLISQFVH